MVPGIDVRQRLTRNRSRHEELARLHRKSPLMAALLLALGAAPFLRRRITALGGQ